jgi:magnesium-transporting ATPase (P-type)
MSFENADLNLVSIRAYAAQQLFKSELYDRIDQYSGPARISWNLNRWIGFRIDILGAMFTTALATYLVYGKTTSAANTGFSLNMATSFCVNIFWLIRMFNLLEVQANRYSIR